MVKKQGKLLEFSDIIGFGIFLFIIDIFSVIKGDAHIHTKKRSLSQRNDRAKLIVIQELKLSSMCIHDNPQTKGSFRHSVTRETRKAAHTQEAGSKWASLQNGSAHGKLRTCQRGWVDQSTLSANVVVVNLLYPCSYTPYKWLTCVQKALPTSLTLLLKNIWFKFHPKKLSVH